MLRRFEAYSFRADADTGLRDRLREALLDSSRRIPEVLHSAIGQPVAGAGADLVWEHGFQSPEAYRRYMEHPFHASVLDRYLLADSPERIVEQSRVGIGLAGYACVGPQYFLPSGIRRLVFLDMRRARPEEIELVADLAGRADIPEVSVFAANSLAAAWFDGETQLGTGPRWSHLWEQGFEDEEALRHHLEEAAESGDRSGTGRDELPGVAAALTLSYRLEPGWGYLAPS
jgi:hypothetical protein